MSAAASAGRIRVSHDEWRIRAEKHLGRARRFTHGARWRKDRGKPHPIQDFLFQYYPFPLSMLEEWHPGHGVEVEWPCNKDAVGTPFCGKHHAWADGHVRAEPSMLTDKERARLAWTVELLERTSLRAPNFACHGLHEWAMVYRGAAVRHERTLKLRLRQAEIDAVVEGRPITCSHYDAYRFFAPDSREFNRLRPTLESRMDMEQPACVHANMDLYKWAAKSMPWIGSNLLLDCFELAVELRELDMRASPYDVTPYGLAPVKIESAEGRREYEGIQKRLATRAAELRARLIRTLRLVLKPPANPVSA